MNKSSRLALLLSGLLLMGGCGSTASTTTQTLTSAPPLSTGAGVTGRVLLAGAESAQVQVVTPSGEPVGEAVTTDSAGNFRLPQALPENFRVQATTSRGEVFFSDYRGLREGTLQVNPLTDLISAYLERHPGVNLEEAARAVKAHLSLPSSFSEHHETGASRYTGLLVERYLNAARAQGGLRTPSGSATSFPLRVAADVGVTLPVSYALDADGDSFMSLLIKGVATGSGEEIGEQVAGWVLSALGRSSQNNVQNQLKSISNQLTQLSNEVNQLATQAAYDNLASQLIGEINVIQTTSNIIANATRPADAAQISTTAAVLQTYIADFHLRQVGGTPAVPQGMMSLLQQETTAKSTLFANGVSFNPLFTQYQYYAYYQTLLANCIVELLHLQQPPSLTLPAAILDTVAANLKTQQALLPLPLPADNLVYDQANQLIWIDQVFGPDSYQNAVNMANNENLGGFRRWRVAGSQPADGKTFETKGSLNYFPNVTSWTSSHPGQSPIGGNPPAPYMLVCDLDDQPAPQLLACGGSLIGPLTIKLTSVSYAGNSVVTQARASATVLGPPPGPQQAPLILPVDVTPYVTWSIVNSTDPNPVRISNYPGSEGVLLYPSSSNQPFTVSASLQSNNFNVGETLQGSAAVGAQNTAFPNQGYFQLSPSGQTLTAQNNALALYCSAFSTVINTATLGLPPMAAYALLPEDWTQTMTWTASSAQAQVTKLNGSVYLQMSPQAPTQDFTVTAAFQFSKATAPFSWLGPAPTPTPAPGPSPTPAPTPLPTPTPTPTPAATVTSLSLSPSSVTLDYKKPEQRTLQFTLRAELSDGSVAYPAADSATQWTTSDSRHTQISSSGELVVIEKPLSKLKVEVQATYLNRDQRKVSSNKASVEIEP